MESLVVIYEETNELNEKVTDCGAGLPDTVAGRSINSRPHRSSYGDDLGGVGFNHASTGCKCRKARNRYCGRSSRTVWHERKLPRPSQRWRVCSLTDNRLSSHQSDSKRDAYE